MREPLYSLAYENFSRLRIQDEHNASCFYKSAAQYPPKNRSKDTTFLFGQAKVGYYFGFSTKKLVFRK